MNDNEIIKALECCIEYDETKNCMACPYCGHSGFFVGCSDAMKKDILDLINRQKAEIEHLQLTTIIGEVREIPMEHKVLALVSWEHPFVEAVKIEAVNEFTERLWCETRDNVCFDGNIDMSALRYISDKIVKEMKEKQK